MRRVLLSVALVLAACAPVTAPVAQAEGASNVAVCVDAAQGRAALEACKRTVVTPCLREPENADSTMGLVECYDREASQWSAMLAAHQRVQRQSPRAEQFAAAQTAWETWRDAECNYQRADAAGGSGEQVVQLACDLDLTADRVIALTLANRAGGSVY